MLARNVPKLVSPRRRGLCAYDSLADHGGLLRKGASLPDPAIYTAFLWCVEVLSLRSRFLIELPLRGIREDGAEL